MSKGADEVMLSSSRLCAGQNERVNHFRRILDNYSTLGLRTLVSITLSYYISHNYT
jgi:magnesium-transporting ATPase (P-type)